MARRVRTILEKSRAKAQIRHLLLRDCLAEFGSTFLLVFLGLCVNAQYYLSGKTISSMVQVNIGWGLAYAFCTYASYRTSGGHLNPAISLLAYSLGRLSMNRLLLYILCQTAASFLAGAAVFGFHSSLINYIDKGKHAVQGETATAMVFSSYPAAHVGFLDAYLDQMIGTATLAFFICVILDERNDIPRFLAPLFIGLAMILIGTCFALNMGYPINPARDLGPRLFSFFIYGEQVFLYPHALFWIAPVIAPLVGGPLGGWLYQLIFGLHLPNKSQEVYRIVETHELKEIPPV